MDGKSLKQLNIKFEKAIRLLSKHLPVSNKQSRKPILFHNIRVGVYLYENKYKEDIVISGLLHDSIEWSDITEKIIENEFGHRILEIVLANTKDDTIQDKHEKTNELIQRCVSCSMDALIVKTADILDSFSWYEMQNNQEELGYCVRTAHAILKYKPSKFNDKIFSELKSWADKYNPKTN